MIQPSARENAATYTQRDTWEREEAIVASAESCIEDLCSPRSCLDYGVAKPVNGRTYASLRKMVKTLRDEIAQLRKVQ